MNLKTSSALALILFCLVGCNESGSRGCLGGGEVCNPSSSLQASFTTVESNSTTAASTSSGFTCTATAVPSQVYAYQWLQVVINVTGGAAGNKTITNFDNYVIPSFSNTATIVGEYFADKAGTVVHRTISLRDTAGATTSCDFQVTVLPNNISNNPPPSVPSCAISVAESHLKAGDTAHFTFNATGASNVTWSNLYGSSSWLLDNSIIQRTNATQATAGLTYSYAGSKTVSIQVNNGSVSNTCSTTFNVGATSLSVTQTPPGNTALNGQFNLTAQVVGVTAMNNVGYTFTTNDSHATIVQTGPNTARVTTNATTDSTVNVVVAGTGAGAGLSSTVPLSFKAHPTSVAFTGCSVIVSPVNSGSQQSAQVAVNASSRITVFPQGGVGPFTAGVGSITSGGSSFGYALETAGSDSQTVNFHFTQVGTPLVTMYLRDTFSNTVQLCSTYAVSH